LIFENILKDWTASSHKKRAVVLRYFNPVGAHDSGLIGENPRDTPNNLMPLIVQTAQQKRQELCIYGADYNTRDGTGERDYIHVVDLARGHLQALNYIFNLQNFQILNLGSGNSTTVVELIRSFEKINNVIVPTRLVERRLGDVAKSYADSTIAHELIGFECKKNPNGYDT